MLNGFSMLFVDLFTCETHGAGPTLELTFLLVCRRGDLFPF